MQITYFLNGPILNLFVFCFFLFLFFFCQIDRERERERESERNVAPILPLKSKLSGKFQRFNAINRTIEMLKKLIFQKFQLK